MKGTLISVQEAQVTPEKSLWDLTVESIETLKQKGLIEASADEQGEATLQITRLGRATFKGTAQDGDSNWEIYCMYYSYTFFFTCFFCRNTLLDCFLLKLLLVFAGSVDLSYCDLLYRDLSKGLEGLLLNSFLHLVYLVTPYDMVHQCKPDWMIYFRQVGCSCCD